MTKQEWKLFIKSWEFWVIVLLAILSGVIQLI